MAEGTGEGIGRGDRIRFFARLKKPVRYQNPGSFDYRRFLNRRGILFTAYVDRPDDVLVLVHGDGILRRIDAWREKVSRIVREAIPGEGGAFVAALVVGDGSGLGEATRADFQATGTSHLIAVSGQHIAMVGMTVFILLYGALKRSEKVLLRFSARGLALSLSLAPIAFYVVLAGSPPSAVRAAFLAAFLALAAVTNREPEPFSSLGAAAILIGLWDLSAPFSASFQLSFLAVLGILAFRSRGSAGLPGRGAWPCAPKWVDRYVTGPFWMTLGATFFTAPLVAYRFHELSLSGLLVNMAAIPFSGILLIAGFLGVLTTLLLPSAGLILLQADGWMADAFLQALHAAAASSRNAHWVASFYPTEAETALAFAFVAILAWMRHRSGRAFLRRHSKTAIAAASLVVLLMSASFYWPRRDLEIVFLDVGQGDSALVLTPSGKTLLVDGGGFLIPGQDTRQSRFEVGRDVIVPYLKRRGIEGIDAVLLSHPHPDHFGGLKGVLDAFPVGEFWWNGQRFPDASFDQLLETVRSKSVRFKILKDGDVFDWAECGIEVLYPGRVDPGRNINDNSLVVRLRFGESSVLFTGDIEKEGERALADLRDIRADVLKIPHHASRTSSSVPFIDSVKPSVAVASLGEDNLFGFPHEGILEKYRRRGVAVYQTGLDGAVTVRLSPASPKKSPAIRTFSSGR